MEKYYSTNGEYPSCSAMSQSPDTVVRDTLVGMDPKVLATPTAPDGTNSILLGCADISDGQDAFAYVGDGGNECLNGDACASYTLKYHSEKEDALKPVSSRHVSEALLIKPEYPIIQVALNGANVVATVAGLICNAGSAQYGFDYRLDDGSWTGFSAWSADTSTSQTANDDTKYGYRAQARCYVSSEKYTDAIVGFEATYIDPITTPSNPVVGVALSGADVVATITPVSCVSGIAQYGIDSRTNDGNWSGYSAWSTSLTASQTANDGVKYGYRAQARCYKDDAKYSKVSSTSAGSEVAYIDPIATPSDPIVAANTVDDTTTWSWSDVTCASGTSARYQYRYTISAPTNYDSGWTSYGSNLSISFTTSTQARTYTVQVQAQCYNSNTTSNWSGSGSANYYRPKVCNSGYVLVPGSSTYGTVDFCIMKYEAKNVSGVATSQAAGSPWTSVTQTEAISYGTAACTGCHLVTEAEWMTIAQNVLGVGSNWYGGVVGANYIYSGHNDSSPFNSIVASTNDSDGYYNTGDSASDTGLQNGMIGRSQRRTLTLSNGQVIWDLSGNVFELTAGTVQSPTVQPGITGGGYAWREWTAITNAGTISPNPAPSSTGLSGSSSWNSTKGVGIIYSSSDNTSAKIFNRSGGYSYNTKAGVLLLDMDYDNTYSRSDIGFRVAH